MFLSSPLSEWGPAWLAIYMTSEFVLLSNGSNHTPREWPALALVPLTGFLMRISFYKLYKHKWLKGLDETYGE